MADFDEKRLDLMLRILETVDAHLIITVPRTSETALHTFTRQLRGMFIAL